jgi:uncharacterized LabA/DUF88 family protein
MPEEPQSKRVVAFFDGQNLFHAALEAFGYTYPNYNPKALATAIAKEQNWQLSEVRFYTGVPDDKRDQFWHHFWTAKLANMGRQGVKRYSRTLRYRTENVTLDNGTVGTTTIKQEKGIDIRIALDIVRMGLDNAYDVALIFSQDQDLSEVADEIKAISKLQDRWIQVASAFPVSSSTTNKRGINNTLWVSFDQTLYDMCIDSADYRPKGITARR